MTKYSFQINRYFGKNRMSAFGSLGLIYAPNFPTLIKKIQNTFDLKIEQIEFTFQPEDTKVTPSVLDFCTPKGCTSCRYYSSKFDCCEHPEDCVEDYNLWEPKTTV